VIERLSIILSIHHRLDPDSGAAGATLALGNAYSALGQDVAYLSFDDLPWRLPEPLGAVAYPHLATIRLIGAGRRRFDVIDASTGDMWLWAAVSRPSDRPLLVTTSHGLDHLFHERIVEHARRQNRRLSWRYPLYRGGWRLREVRRSLRAADLVFVLNDTEREYVIDRLGIDPERVALTANGLTPRFLDLARSANTSGARTSIACLGGYLEMKGVEYGARALTGVLETYPQLTASFFGTGVPREEVLRRFPRRLHRRITTVERYRRDELPKLLDGHGILLFPSLSEGFGLALLEAMACGLAPVAAASDGAGQIVKSDHNGLLAAAADAQALRAALVRLLQDRVLLDRLQVEARRSAERYSWRRIAAERLDAYREALERRRAA
jgi:glycosyltransferase involved in cell wall biosynthesis